MVARVESDPQRFYALVDFTLENAPDVFIVPSIIIRDAAEEADREFHRRHPGTTQTGMRKIHDPYPFPVSGYDAGWLDEYRDNWTPFSNVSA